MNGKDGSRREFFRSAGRCLVLGLAAAGTGLLMRSGKVDPAAPRCGGDGRCALCPRRKGCGRAPARRKDAHGGA